MTIRGEREVMVDDIIKVTKEVEEERRAESDGRTELDERPTTAEERIR